MCTVTIHRASDRLLVTMNRDERRDRAPERPPELHRGDICWLAPSDSERGGTWMAVNERGVVACIMNGYLAGEGPAPPTTANARSRGEIVPWLMPCGDATDMRRALEHGFDPERYPSFTLMLADSNTIHSFAWRGSGALEHETHNAEWNVFSSSSWRTQEVVAWRTRAFEDWLANGCAMRGALPALHLLQPGDRREWSPLMDREKTCTRSITQIEVAYNSNDAFMRYWRRDAVDAGAPPIVAALPLRAERELTRHG